MLKLTPRDEEKMAISYLDSIGDTARKEEIEAKIESGHSFSDDFFREYSRISHQAWDRAISEQFRRILNRNEPR